MTFELHLGDCLEVMHSIEDASVDMILADLPYGTTACKWDTIIPLEPLWKHYKRIIKRNGAIVLTASQPFTSALVMSNPKWFKHSWSWDKGYGTDFQLARVKPLKAHEDVLVFSPSTTTYNPQMQEREQALDNRTWTKSLASKRNGGHKQFASIPVGRIYTHYYPTTILRFHGCAAECNHTKRLHPTQKPVALMEYLIRTYTNEGETVLDNTMGSGTTGVACINTNRSFIGIEKDAGYFQIATERIEKARNAFKQAELGVAS